MINKIEITKKQALNAIETGEFGNDILLSKDIVVVIMTQNWCPQWIYMKNWIYGVKIEREINVYELVYNKTDFFHEFMDFKENKWRNYDVPYLRFYKGGRLIKESNYINKEEFIKALEL